MLCLDLNFPFLLIIITAMDGLLVTIKLFPLNFCNESCVGTDGPFAQLSSANVIHSEGLLKGSKNTTLESTIRTTSSRSRRKPKTLKQ